MLRNWWRIAGCVLLATFIVVLRAQADAAAVNAWTRGSGGAWEEQPSWSLGTLPGPDQSVLLANAGWKALAIGQNTAQNFPQTLNVDSIGVSSPQDSYNVLLLNYAGYGTPLRAGSVSIASGAALTLLGSMLSVTNTGTAADRLQIGGTVNQGGYSAVRTTYLDMGSAGPGAYNFTNGLISVSTGYVSSGAVFNQFGGYSWAGQITVGPSGEYDLYDGEFGGAAVLEGGVFRQTGGLFNAGLGLKGTYLLEGGIFTNAGIAVPPDALEVGVFTQSGGTNRAASLIVGVPYPNSKFFAGAGYCTLSNGLFATGSVLLRDFGRLDQWGGTLQVDGPFSLRGEMFWQNAITEGQFLLHDGSFSAGSMDFSYAGYVWQGGGSARIGELTISTYAGSYNLQNGMLAVSNLNLIGYIGVAFRQDGGTNTVANQLKISGGWDPASNGYLLTGGTLSAPNIEISNGSQFLHSGGEVADNVRLTLAHGSWEARAGTTRLGQLQLNVGDATNSTLLLPPGPSVVRFGDSHALAWASVATLTVENWQGSVSGGGQHRIFFGADAGALGAGQLRQIQFLNPAGFNGRYPALILPTGEIVPGPLVGAQRIAGALVLSWPAGCVLQSATNVAGPYADITGAVSPCTNALSEPQRFFRLRQ